MVKVLVSSYSIVVEYCLTHFCRLYSDKGLRTFYTLQLGSRKTKCSCLLSSNISINECTCSVNSMYTKVISWHNGAIADDSSCAFMRPVFCQSLLLFNKVVYQLSEWFCLCNMQDYEVWYARHTLKIIISNVSLINEDFLSLFYLSIELKTLNVYKGLALLDVVV